MLEIVLNLNQLFTEKINFETNSNIYNKSICSLSLAQTATIQGVILSEFNEPSLNANITK